MTDHVSATVDCRVAPRFSALSVAKNDCMVSGHAYCFAELALMAMPYCFEWSEL